MLGRDKKLIRYIQDTQQLRFKQIIYIHITFPLLSELLNQSAVVSMERRLRLWSLLVGGTKDRHQGLFLDEDKKSTVGLATLSSHHSS